MILIDLVEWIVNFLVLGMGLVAFSMGMFLVTLVMFSISLAELIHTKDLISNATWPFNNPIVGPYISRVGLPVFLLAIFIYFNSNVNLEIVKKMFVFVFCFTIFARYIALQMESVTLQLIIAISLVVAAFQVAIDVMPKKITPEINFVELALVSCGIGLITSLVGIGGGILMVPYFTFRGLSMRDAIGTSSVMGFFIAISGSIGGLLFAPKGSESINWMIGSAYFCLLYTSDAADE